MCLIASKGVLALFQHDNNGCGPIFVPKVNPSVDRSLPLAILPPSGQDHPHQALLRMPMICSQEAMAMFLSSKSPQDFYSSWFDAASRNPVVGSVLVALPALAATTEQLDVWTANTLLLASALAPLVLQHAERRLLQATITCGALGSTPPSGVAYIPGQGFVAHTAGDDAERLLELLGSNDVAPVEPVVAEDDVDSSCGSLDSVNQERATPAAEEAVPASKRRRCADDAQSIARSSWDDDDDIHDDDCGGRSSRSMRLSLDVAHPAQSHGSSSSQGASQEDTSKGKQHAVSAGGQCYADHALEARFLAFMYRDMTWIKRCVLLSLVMVAIAVGRQLWDNLMLLTTWEAKAVLVLSMFNVGLVLAVHSVPMLSARYGCP